MGNNQERDREKLDGDVHTGTFIMGATAIDGGPFKEAVPIARFGNLFIFRGTFNVNPPKVKARSLCKRSIYQKVYTAEPNIEEAIKLLSEAVALDPTAFIAALELGNQYLKIGNRVEALRAYRIAKENAPESDDIGELSRAKSSASSVSRSNKFSHCEILKSNEEFLMSLCDIDSD